MRALFSFNISIGPMSKADSCIDAGMKECSMSLIRESRNLGTSYHRY